LIKLYVDSVLGDDVAVIQSVSEKKALSWIKKPHQALVSLSFDDRGIVFEIRPDAEISAECRLSNGQKRGWGLPPTSGAVRVAYLKRKQGWK